MSNLDYNALKGLQDQLADIENKYPENKTFRGNPDTHYFSDKNGNRLTDAQYNSLSASERKGYSGHFDKYIDERIQN